MAQLRDAQTSELIMEGTPLEVAVCAQGFDDADILFDGVGGQFDAKAHIKARNDDLKGMRAALADPATTDQELRDRLQAAIDERQARIDRGRNAVAEARRAAQAARDRSAKRARG